MTWRSRRRARRDYQDGLISPNEYVRRAQRDGLISTNEGEQKMDETAASTDTESDVFGMRPTPGWVSHPHPGCQYGERGLVGLLMGWNVLAPQARHLAKRLVLIGVIEEGCQQIEVENILRGYDLRDVKAAETAAVLVEAVAEGRIRAAVDRDDEPVAPEEPEHSFPGLFTAEDRERIAESLTRSMKPLVDAIRSTQVAADKRPGPRGPRGG